MSWSVRWGSFAGRCLPILLLAALAGFPAQPVVAQDPPPPPPPVTISRLESPAMLAPAGPCVSPCLYDQTDAADPTFVVLSQDSAYNPYDSQAADDFTVPGSTASWHITAIQVPGHFGSGGGDTASVNSFNVLFYADSGGLPGIQLPAAASASISATATSPSNFDFYMPLNHAVDLAANGTYWVSVQAVQSTSWYWYWRERTQLALHPAVWQNPSGGFGNGCVHWTTINTCFAGNSPDLSFRLYGAQSSNHVTPILASLSPDYAFKRTFTLNAAGVGFASGAVVNWSLGNRTFATTVSGPTDLTALVPAAAVTGALGTVVNVSVTNPGPCAGSCTSNTLTFILANRTFLPTVRR